MWTLEEIPTEALTSPPPTPPPTTTVLPAASFASELLHLPSVCLLCLFFGLFNPFFTASWSRTLATCLLASQLDHTWQWPSTGSRAPHNGPPTPDTLRQLLSTPHGTPRLLSSLRSGRPDILDELLFQLSPLSASWLSHILTHYLREERITLQLFKIRFFGYSCSHYVWQNTHTLNNCPSLCLRPYQQPLQVCCRYLHPALLHTSARAQISSQISAVLQWYSKVLECKT